MHPDEIKILNVLELAHEKCYDIKRKEFYGCFMHRKDTADMKKRCFCLLLAAAMVSAAVWYCLRVLREILAPMKEGSPFTAGTSRKIRKLAWTVLVAGGIAEAGMMLSSVFQIQAYHIEKLLNPSVVSSVTFDFKTGVWFVVPALFLFFLSYIFRYGEELQREADETL